MDSRTPSRSGGNTGNNVGSIQWDAIRNIWGLTNGAGSDLWCDGAFFQTAPKQTHGGTFYKWGGDTWARVGFDASRVVPVGGDNRPKNVYVTYIIKY
jgi:hypothetical protein